MIAQISLQESHAIAYSRSVDWTLIQAERARMFGVSERTARRYERILEGLVEQVESLFEPVAWLIDRTKRIYEISKESFLGVLIATRNTLGTLLIALTNDSGIDSEDSAILEEELRVNQEATESDDKDSLSNDRDSLSNGRESLGIPVEPKPDEPFCIKHFCKNYKDFVHLNRQVEECSCGLTFDDCLEQIGDPIKHISVCGGNL